MKIYLATNNLHKVREFQALVKDELINFLPLPVKIVWDEKGDTFAENAIIKAQEVAKIFAEDWILADDSGLCVDALDGRPGVFSARYAGPEASDAENRAKLLQEMLAQSDRKAQFFCALALMKGKSLEIFSGVCTGQILVKENGVGGFGYDSLFMPDGYDKSFAELSSHIKNAISHRGVAFCSFLSRASASFL